MGQVNYDQTEENKVTRVKVSYKDPESGLELPVLASFSQDSGCLYIPTSPKSGYSFCGVDFLVVMEKK